MSRRSSKTSHVLNLITQKNYPADALTETDMYAETNMHLVPDAPVQTDTYSENDTQNSSDDSFAVSEMIFDEELSQHSENNVPASAQEYEKEVTKTPAEDFVLEWSSSDDERPFLKGRPVKSTKNSELKNMISDSVDVYDNVSLLVKRSLEEYFLQEYPQAKIPQLSHIYIEGDDKMTDNNNSKTQHTLSNLGTEFVHDGMDSVTPVSFSDPESSAIYEELPPEKFIFVNVAEEIVRSKVLPMMKDFEMCTCDRCTNDVVALALNKLPPKYVVTMKGRLYARINACLPQYQTDTLTAITDACNTVRNNSRHNQTVETADAE
jgi:competence protein ComFB